MAGNETHPRRAASWFTCRRGVGIVAAAAVGSLGIAQLGNGARPINQQLELAVSAFNETQQRASAGGRQRWEQLGQQLFHPEAELQIQGYPRRALDPASVASLAEEMWRHASGTRLSMEVPQVHWANALATAEFRAVLSSRAGNVLRAERRNVRVRLTRVSEDRWLIRFVEVGSPDEADPEARP